jgi:hypothetical protein
MNPRISAFGAFALAWLPLAAWSQVSSYDPATRLVTIPSVSVAGSTFRDVTLLDTGNYVFTLQGAMPQVPAAPGIAQYDVTTGVLTLPAVKVGTQTFLDVQLKDIGNYTFTLQAASALPASTQAAVVAFFAQVDAMFATAVPATGAARLAQADACWREDGRTRANAIADWDARGAEVIARNAYQIGRRTSNIQVTGVRNKTNPDGSTRQEIDVQVDVTYKDGTMATASKVELISGSSSGTPGCSTAQTGAGLRGIGNQRLVATAVRSRNLRDERYLLASGNPASPAVNYRRSVQWAISDPMGNADYVIVTGPGPAATVNGVATQFSLKFLSPRLQRSAPEMQGKTGNFLNWLDDDNFRYCRGGTVPVAAIADCIASGPTAFDWGWTTSNPNASADDGFAGQGFVSGGVYRFDVYKDDGWKTVNGHAGRTPIATYYDTLQSLPHTFVQMAGSGPSADRFPRLKFGASSLAQVASNVASATPAPLAVTWNAPSVPPNGLPVALAQSWEFHNGARIGNTAGAFYPAFRNIHYFYPASTALANPAWAVTPKLAEQQSKNYTEFSVLYSDRNDVNIISLVSFQ